MLKASHFARGYEERSALLEEVEIKQSLQQAWSLSPRGREGRLKAFFPDKVGFTPQGELIVCILSETRIKVAFS